MVRFIRRFIRTICYLIINITAMPIQLAAFRFAPHLLEEIPLRYHRLCLRLFGIRVRVNGSMATARPTLFVANHVSYLDIPILASVIPGCFVAKREVASWPLFGWLAKLQRTVFVSRRNQDVGEQNDSVNARLGKGDNLIVFPEGTNTDGNHLAPFRTSVFQAALDYASGRPLTIQPVSINCLALEGVSAGRAGRQIYSWYGTSNNVFVHLWHYLGFVNSEVQIEFHPPLTVSAFTDRKTLAAAAEAAVRGGLSAINRGRIDSSR